MTKDEIQLWTWVYANANGPGEFRQDAADEAVDRFRDSLKEFSKDQRIDRTVHGPKS